MEAGDNRAGPSICLVMMASDVPLQRGNDLGDVVRVLDLFVQFGEVGRGAIIVDDAIKLVEDVRLGVVEVLLVMFDVVEEMLDLVFDLVFLAVVRGLARVHARRQARGCERVDHFDRHLHVAAARRAAEQKAAGEDDHDEDRRDGKEFELCRCQLVDSVKNFHECPQEENREVSSRELRSNQLARSSSRVIWCAL